MPKSTIVNTPLMRQYNHIKSQHPDAILLFRVGDFYETFSDDAVTTSDILGITLTKRANGAASYVELAGFPYHALDTYLPKLVRAGQRVAICEQLEDPKKTKKIVKRGITELVTPGVSLNDNVLENKENNYLACVHFNKKSVGVAFLDISTGEFLTAEGNTEYIDKLLHTFLPKEVLYERSYQKRFEECFGNKFYIYPLEDWAFKEETAYDRLLKQFDTVSLKGFGIENYRFGIVAAGAILQYLDLTQHKQTNHITRIARIEEDRYVWLDKFTVRNLELTEPIHPGGTTLLQVLDKSITPMGGRLLRRWLALPLKEKKPIEDRLHAVEYFINHTEFTETIETQLKAIGDLERLASKIAVQRITPREVIQIKNALQAIIPIKNACQNSENPDENPLTDYIKSIGEQLNACSSIMQRIEKEINDEPPAQINKGNAIKNGVSEELDELRHLSTSSKEYLDQLQQRQAKITGIQSLKISFNNVFGYYFEVKNTFKNRVPKEWIRKQTLVSGERYVNEELKEYETKILGAEEKILELENRLFQELTLSLMDYIPALQLNANLLATLDGLRAFAQTAAANDYKRPGITEDTDIDIKQGRHPVIEQQLPIGEPYISNNIYLDCDSQQIVIITGPNMSGKSALLRQTALIVLMAQTGSFVPAESATIGMVDKIFTRVGASDNISLGESTFMVEMNEAASILNNISSRSLILFDELGRGTSTYDGISIAWAIVEYLHTHKQFRPKTLFATHYHELNEMENSFNRIKNYNVSVREVNNQIIFLRKLVRGGSEHSFGIHVAQMAGMPKSVVKRADEILAQLENGQDKKTLAKPVENIAQSREGYQLSFFQLDDPVLKQIRDEIANTDINNLTPVEALNKLHEIKKLIGNKKKKKRR